MPDDNFRILGQREVTRLNPNTRKAESGFEIDVADNVSGVHFEVFVPTANYPNAAQQTIRDKLAQIRAVHNLGTPVQ